MAKSKIHWYYGCCWGRACDLQCASASFAKQAAENPDWYCVTCTKAARLALAKEQPIAVSFSSTVRRCARCRSGAINPSDHGRTEGADLDLCDVCYWRKRAESATWPTPRPISEAPKDGTMVLIQVPSYMAQWTMGLFDRKHWIDLCCADAIVEPTHFLPLPPEVR
jgi:hypothetical protein